MFLFTLFDQKKSHQSIDFQIVIFGNINKNDYLYTIKNNNN
nr:MAG TPA: hypothetical protein [Caudoviricetes sp.]